MLGAGPLANFIFALFLFWLALVIGPPAIAVNSVEPNSPAMEAGLMAGDAIMQINGEKVDNSNALVNTVYENAGQPVDLLIKRDGQEINLTIVPRLPGEFDPAVEGPLGVALTNATNGERISSSPIEAIGGSFSFLWDYISLYARLPSMLINGEITAQEARPVSIVGISQIAGQAAESSATSGNAYPILSIAAFISVALGLTNLLPIPALDGGRIMFVLLEAVRGRRIEPEREGMVHAIGMLVMLGLMALLIVQDIINPIIPMQ
ncbi:MAG: M50 family metallopeptidase [Chloroflexota bacterium]